MKKILLVFYLTLLNIGNLQSQETQIFNSLQATSVTVLPLMESEVFHLINKHRVANLLKPLSWSSLPAHLARLHSKNMAAGLVPFGHDGVALRYAQLKAAMPSLTRFGENVAYNFGYPNPAEVAVNGWLASPGHYSNIMGDYNLSGVGVAVNSRGEHYFTQIFVKASSTVSESNQEKSLLGEGTCIYNPPVEWEADF